MARTRPSRAAAIAAAIAITLLAACSDDQKESARSAVDEALDDAGEAIDNAVTEVSRAVDEAASDAAELVVRNIATEQGEEQFRDAGDPIDGKLSCTATVDGDVRAVAVSCTGTTESGGQAALEGTTDELPGASVTELEGDFTGTVDGDEVFTTDHLGGG